ncbi:membrane-associated oxidoreductase [Streptomyces tendae]|uniref:membrane-associated oxidoreductase n=1 Tax=Streptomyces tendae TaxID=1932 RepID=UPI0036AAA17F
MEINDLTPAESRLWRAFASGTDVDFRTAGSAAAGSAADFDDPAGGGTWGPERTVRASVLRSLLLDGPREDGRVAALSLAGARVTGRLDLQYATVDHPVRLRHCHFDEAPRFYGARLRELNLSESVLPGLVSHAVRVEGVLRLTRARFSDTVRLAGAEVTGSLYLESTRIETPNTEWPVLQLNQAVLGADLWAPGLRAGGEVRLTGARVAGTINLNDSVLDRPGGSAVQAETLAAEADVLLRRADVRGRLELRGARIPGRLDLSHARLANAGNTALRASSCVIGELWLREGPAVQGALRRTLPWYGRLWGHLQDVAVGYGFRPLRAGGWLLSLLAVGSVAYGLHHPPALKPAEAPGFDPVFYTLDLLLPVISFGQENAFAPEGWYQTLSYVLIVTGWILATTVITGLTRTVSRQ